MKRQIYSHNSYPLEDSSDESDRQYLSRFELDPEIEFRWEDLYRVDIFDEFVYDDEMVTLDDEKILDV